MTINSRKSIPGVCLQVKEFLKFGTSKNLGTVFGTLETCTRHLLLFEDRSVGVCMGRGEE